MALVSLNPYVYTQNNKIKPKLLSSKDEAIIQVESRITGIFCKTKNCDAVMIDNKGSKNLTSKMSKNLTSNQILLTSIPV